MVLLLAGKAEVGFDQTDRTCWMTHIVAHRGDRAHAPENTRRAFEAALAAGAEMLEMDLRLSADGTVMVFHDDVLDSLTSERGALRERSAAELAGVAVLPDRHPAGEDSTIPTLARVLEEFGGRTDLYLELKDLGRDNATLARAVLDLVPADSPHVLASFDAELLSLCLEAGRPTVWIAANAKALRQHPHRLEGLHAMSLRHDQWDAASRDAVLERGVQPWAWTVNDRRSWCRLQRMGLDAICTDDPGAARSWREECG